MSSGLRSALSALALLAILTAGVAIGVVVDRRWLGAASAGGSVEVSAQRRGSDARRTARLMDRFRKQLHLTDDQARAVSTVLERSRSEVSTLRARIEPEIEASRKRSREDVERLLNDGQKQKYRQLVDDYEARRRARRAAREAP